MQNLKRITYHVSVSLRDTRVTDHLVYVHCNETEYQPENYPHHEIAGYALIATVPDQNGKLWEHPIGFNTDNDTLMAMAEAARDMVDAILYRSATG